MQFSLHLKGESVFSYTISNCTIVDGLGGTPYKADIGITDDEISFIGKLPEKSNGESFDGRDLHLLPGFIDIHSHSDIDVLFNPREFNKISQGVTTECGGNCGYSLFPVTEEAKPAVQAAAATFKRPYDFNWSDGRSYFKLVEKAEPGFNYIPLVGHGFLRINAMGFDAAPADEKSLHIMKKLLASELEGGCFGFSTGLEYMPGCFADYNEIEELCRLTASYGGVYTSHLRDQGEYLVENVAEAVRLAQRTGVSVIVSHLKAHGKAYWGKTAEALRLIEEAQSEGIRILADFYPYDYSSTTLDYILPSWSKEGGPEALKSRLQSETERLKIRSSMEEAGDHSFDKIYICKIFNEEYRNLIGKSIQEAAEMEGKDCFNLVFELIESNGGGVETVSNMMDQAEVDRLAGSPSTIVGSDSYALDRDILFTGHPRNYGTFPRFINRYVSEKNIMDIQTAVRKTSSIAADFLGISDRGTISKGKKADLVLTDLSGLKDRATYKQPGLRSDGITAVFVNGKLQYKDSSLQGKGAGRILRRK